LFHFDAREDMRKIVNGAYFAAAPIRLRFMLR
jgi:hypothetical protein